MDRRIVVTGASSPLGALAVERLRDSGTFEVLALRSPRRGSDRNAGDPLSLAVDLAAPLPARVRDLLRGADRVLHFAWDRRGDALGRADTNRTMVANLMSYCRAGALVFVSSVAGAPNARSAYGRQKHALAETVRASGGSVLLPGLVVSDPPFGPYALLDRVVAEVPAALRLTGTPPRVYPVTMPRLLDMIEAVADPDLPPATWRGFDGPVPFNDFMATLEARHARRRLPVRVPAPLLLSAAAGLKRAPLPTRAYCDKILTFLHKNDAHLARALILPLPETAQPDETIPKTGARQ